MNALNPALHKDAMSRPLKRPNALHPDHMTAQERRTEICSLLALALARPHQREFEKPSENIGKRCPQFPAEQSAQATSTRKELA